MPHRIKTERQTAIQADWIWDALDPVRWNAALQSSAFHECVDCGARVPDKPADGRFYQTHENPLAKGWAVTVVPPDYYTGGGPSAPRFWAYLCKDCRSGADHKEPQATTDRLVAMLTDHKLEERP